MLRRNIPVFAILSTAAPLAVALLWVRSYFVTDAAWRAERRVEGRESIWRFRSGRGGVGVQFDNCTYKFISVRNSPQWGHVQRKPPHHPSATGFSVPPDLHVAFAGFSYSAARKPDTNPDSDLALPAKSCDLRSLVIPYWSLLCATATPPALAWARWRRRRTRQRRMAEGLCAVCGYDLRASKGRCPECGVPARADAA
jgi:hypothetical protein